MSRTEKEAIVICLDVGKDSSEISDKSGRTFFERSIECTRKIITRKIFSKPNDEIGIVLYGSDETKNDLYDQDLGYENIVELDTMKMPSWNMVEKVENIKQGNRSVGWSDVLVAAIQYMSNETQAKKFTNLRIILFTNFMSSTNENDLDVISENISNLGIELIGVSDCVQQEQASNDATWHFSQNPSKNQKQHQSQRVFLKMSESIESSNLCHIDYVESQLVYFQKKTARGMPWNVGMKIGSELTINVSAYVYIQQASIVSFKSEYEEMNTVTKMVTDYTRNNETIEKPNPEDIVNAYFYGSKLNPVDDSNDCYDKCLSCLGFAERKNFNTNLFAGKGCHIVVPQKDCPKAAQLFSSLVENMIQNDFFMVARKVYRKGSKSMIVGLFPEKTETGLVLVMIEMPYEQDIHRCRYEKFRMKQSTKPSDEQMEAMKNLVESMDLMNALDDDSGISEAFTIENTPNPFHQYICRVVAHRATHPNDPLPTFHDELKKMIDVPEKIKYESADAIKKIEQLFPLEIIHHNERKVFGQKSTDPEIAVGDAADDVTVERHVIAVGTVTPAEDFLFLVDKKAERFGKLCEQIEGVIYELMFKTAADCGVKIIESILAYRESAKAHGPFNYNTWIKEFKKLMISKNKVDEWNKYIVKEGFGLITINESPISTVTIEENLEFYEMVSTEATSMNTSVYLEDDNLENLL